MTVLLVSLKWSLMRGNGMLTADKFIDYVFGTEVSGSQKKLLRDLAENGIIETSYTLWFCFAYWPFCIPWIKMATLEVLEDAAPECIRFAIFWLGFVEGMVEMLYAVEKGRHGAWNLLIEHFQKKDQVLAQKSKHVQRWHSVVGSMSSVYLGVSFWNALWMPCVCPCFLFCLG